MIEKETKYLETYSLTDYGYFRIDNAFDLNTFADLAEQTSPKITGYIEHVRSKTGMKREDIPLKLDLPARPEGDLSWEELNLSLAELAGAATAIKMVTKRDVIYFGHTHLGRFAKRWFNVFRLDSDIAPDGINGWMADARGERSSHKLDPHLSVVYKSGEELFDQHDITITKPDGAFVIRFGDIKIEIKDEARVSLDSGVLSRKDLHAFIGFSKMLFLFNTTRQSKTPFLRLVGSPLKPYSAIDNVVAVENIIKIDKIRSYLLSSN